MTQTGPWSVKGIDQRAREAAREAAREEGLTLGEYLNRLLMNAEEEEASPIEAPYQTPKPAPNAASSTLDRLTRRIEATEARSTLAITGIDQTLLGLVARLENNENDTSSVAGYVESLIEELRDTHRALKEKVTALEADDTNKKNLDALKSLEDALGKLASHVYTENEMVQDETQAIKGRVEGGFTHVNERVEAMETKVETKLSEAAARVERAVEQAELRAEGTARHLSERVSTLETRVHESLSTVESANERLGAVEGDVGGALESMEGTLLRIQERLNRAETTTDAALKALESSFENLDQRIAIVAEAVDPEAAEKLRDAFEARFEDLTSSVREQVELARAELADEIARAASGQDSEVFNTMKDNLADMQRRLITAEERQSRTDDNIGEHVSRVASSLEQRIRDVEANSSEVSADIIHDEVSRLAESVDERLSQIEEREVSAIETVGEEMGKITETLGDRIMDSEQRSADAIGQIGEQVSLVAGRMQQRQDEAFKAFSDQLEDNRKRSDARLSDALANVSERLSLMQSQASASLSPVQKAIASLATRLENLEDFTAPPYTQSPADQVIPDMPVLPDNEPLFNSAEFDDLDTGPAEEDLPAMSDSAPEADMISETELNAGERLDADIRAAADQIDPDAFEPGIEGWEVTPSAAQNYSDDFEGVAINAADPAEQEYVADLPGEPDAEGSGVVGSEDPLEALGNWDDEASETRESDIFDDEFDTAHADVETLPGEPFNDSEDAADSPAEMAASAEDTSDYIARARRAALAASSSNEAIASTKEVRRGKRGGGGGGKKTGGKKTGGAGRTPLYAAGAAVVIAGAAAGGYMYLRGKQAAPVQTAAVNMYQPGETGSDEQISADTGAEAADTTDTANPVDTAKPADTTEDMLFGDTTDSAEHSEENAETGLASDSDGEAPQQTAALANHADFAIIPPAMTAESAAATGNRIAQFQLGETLIGAGDYAAGTEMIGRAATKGLPVAQYRYAKLHEKGLGVPKDLALARQWTEKAAKGGNVKAMHDLAVFFAEGEGGPQSYAGAVEWFRKAAEFGVVDSQYNLGVMYEQGLGISPDLTEALFWYAVAARLGDASAPGKVQELASGMSVDVAQKTRERATSWRSARANSIANGRFGAQPWNMGNPLQVKGVQTALNAMGYEAGTPDGSIGPATARAIRAYQADAGLGETGKISAELIDSLNARANPARGSR